MSPLQGALDDYLRLRRALGFGLVREGRLLPQFVTFLERHDHAALTAALALRWALVPAGASRRWAYARLAMVRGFARYLAARDPRTEVPSLEWLPAPPAARRVPYLYTDAEVCALVQAARTLPGLKGATYATLIGLLAATGMRVGEAIALARDDVDPHDRVLCVRQGKFGKSRALPLHPTTTAALRVYARARDRVLPHPRSPSFLLSRAGTRLHYTNVHATFLRLLHRAGLAARRPSRPRLHDLRHTFAVTTLVRWYRAGVDVEVRLPALSTYLGHVAPSSTYWYLTATPELLQLAHRRAQRVHEARP
jgi:integrase